MLASKRSGSRSGRMHCWAVSVTVPGACPPHLDRFCRITYIQSTNVAACKRAHTAATLLSIPMGDGACHSPESVPAGTRQRIMTTLGLAQEQGRHTMPHACRVPADALTEHDNVENNARHGCQPQRQRPEVEVPMLHGKLRYACVRATPLLAPARPPSETAVHIDIDIGTRSISISIYIYIYR